MTQQPKKPFATVMQGVLIALLVLSLLLIAQQISFQIYQIGLILLGVAAITQIGFGNVPPESDFATSIKYLILSYIIVGSVFVLGILLAPTLIRLARG
jgi:hypothetical protein